MVFRTEEPINLDGIESEFFRDAIRRGVRNYVGHFGERLVAIYVRGSVPSNEAVPGVSDLDMMAFIADAPVEADREWWDHAPEEVEGEVGRPIPLAELFGPPAPEGVRWQMVYAPGAEVLGYRAEVQADLLKALRYNATLVWGRDITEGREIPPPDLAWARADFPVLWDYVRDLAGLPNEGRFDPDPLPPQPSLQLRKLARHAVFGGVYLLAGLGEFRSFRGADVIPALEQRYPEWTKWLEETRGLYIEPRETTPEEVAAYVSRLVTWVEWIGQQFDQSAPSNLVQCAPTEQQRMSTIVQPTGSPRVLSSDQALKIARLDAEQAYRDLTPYRISIVLEVDGWHIDYELKDPNLNGGGPHYLIDAASGAILRKRYEQ